MTFSMLEDGEVILISRGIYRSCRLAVLDSGDLFAKVSSGFVRLYSNGQTSSPNYQIYEISINRSIFANNAGYMNIIAGVKSISIRARELGGIK